MHKKLLGEKIKAIDLTWNFSVELSESWQRY